MLGKKLKKLRVDKGCTLETAAKQVGVSAASLSKYENGIHKPRDIIMIRLADFYEVSVDELEEELAENQGDRERIKRKLCPWRTQSETDPQSGKVITVFLPCMGKQCMAYMNDCCGRIGNTENRF